MLCKVEVPNFDGLGRSSRPNLRMMVLVREENNEFPGEVPHPFARAGQKMGKLLWEIG